MRKTEHFSNCVSYIKGACDFKSYHEDGETGSSFLTLDYEEHPDLSEEDLEPLGKLLLERIDKYIEDKKDRNFKVEKHSSSFHVLYKGEEIAKVWHNGWHNSQIKKESGALKVAEELVRILSDKSECSKMPKLIRDGSGKTPYQIVHGCTTLASFKYKKDANKYMDEYVFGKYGQKIDPSSGCGGGISQLFNSRKSGDTIILYKGNSVYNGKNMTDILYHLREFIHDKIEEVG